ncbi:creatininase [Zhaonella formicivorans]|uniref:creatininase n=1 Tax=Zhaonella formicivorans TaxID=2528593 RepID=UPI0010F12719|nr:creatininase [Zhaonella formicivorans]
MNAYLIQNLTWKEYQAKAKDGILIIPAGSTEQHGFHLPLGVDAIIASNFALRVAEKVGGVVAPTLTYGYKSQPSSGGGPLFPGTIDLNGATFTSLVKDILTEFLADGWQKIFILDAHYENEAFIAEACDLILRNPKNAFPKVLLGNWWDNIDPDLLAKIFDEVEFRGWALEHAAITETSLMMYFAPELVHQELSIDESFNPPTYQCFPLHDSLLPSSGSLYTARSSSADKGKIIVDNVVEKISSFLTKEFSELS